MLKRLFMLMTAIIVVGGIYVAFERYGPGGGGAAQAQKPAVASAPPVPVMVSTARVADFPVDLEGLGQVQALNTVTIHTRVDGQIEKLYFKQGQMVKEGDLLVEIDPAPFQAALDEAKAKLAEDQANLNNAKLDLQRYSTLAQQSFASTQQLNTQQALVSSDTAQVQADQAAIDAAQVQLGYTQIKAPISGRIGFRLVDRGNIVHASDAGGILTIAQLQPISVVFAAPGDQVDRINAAMQAGPVQVTALSDDGSRTLDTGKLMVVNNEIDPTTETIQLKATFSNPNFTLWPGLAVDTRMLVDTLHNVIVIPDDAVQHGQNGLYAFVVTNNDTAAIRPIEVSDTGNGLSVVTKGLAAGDCVVTAGSYRLQEGTRVAATEGADNQTAQE